MVKKNKSTNKQKWKLKKVKTENKANLKNTRDRSYKQVGRSCYWIRDHNLNL